MFNERLDEVRRFQAGTCTEHNDVGMAIEVGCDFDFFGASREHGRARPDPGEMWRRRAALVQLIGAQQHGVPDFVGRQ